MPTLKALSLRGIYAFDQEITNVAAAFPLSNLRTLKLHGGRTVFSLLDHWLASNQPIKLKIFHVFINSIPIDGLMSLTRFLDAFMGLIDLSVVTFLRMDLEYARAVLSHRETLKRFVHQLDLTPFEVPRSEPICKYAFASAVELRGRISDVVCSPTLKCIGLGYPPDCLVRPIPFDLIE